MVSQNVVKKAITFACRVGAPILGVIANMSGFTCPSCGVEHAIFGKRGGKTIAGDMHVALLGTIPIAPRFSEDSDQGVPFIIKHDETAAATVFNEIVKRLYAVIAGQRKKGKISQFHKVCLFGKNSQPSVIVVYKTKMILYICL